MSSIRSAFRLLLVAWAGSLWSLAWVTQTLFRAQPDRHLAGVLVGRLFTIETFIGLGVGILALLLPGRSRFLWGYAAILLLAVNQWALKPVLAAARVHGTAAGLTFGAWHGVSALLYVLACIGAVVLIWKEEFR